MGVRVVRRHRSESETPVKIRNVRPYSVTLGPVVAGPGEEVEVPDEIGTAALEQPANWAAAPNSKSPKSPKSADDGEKESAS